MRKTLNNGPQHRPTQGQIKKPARASGNEKHDSGPISESGNEPISGPSSCLVFLALVVVLQSCTSGRWPAMAIAAWLFFGVATGNKGAFPEAFTITVRTKRKTTAIKYRSSATPKTVLNTEYNTENSPEYTVPNTVLKTVPEYSS